MGKPGFRAGWLLVVIALTAAGLAAIILLHRYQLDGNSPEAVLERADRLSWNNQWMEAAPLYAEAESGFVKTNRPSEALYAHVSQFIPRAESEDLATLLFELQQDQTLSAAQDPETKLRILTIEGMIETNYDASMARATWRQVQLLAKHQHHYQLMMRAIGEQGIADFLLGDLANAKKLVVRAWLSAKYLGDPAAQVRYASVYGTGLVELHRYSEAISVLNEAIATATHVPGIAYPSIAVNSKIDALRGLHRYQEALALSDEAIRQLPEAHLDAHLFQVLTSKGEVYEDLSRWRDAAHQYDLALDYARRLDYWRGITQTGGLLARVYEQENEPAQALVSINEAVDANRHLPRELYFMPGNLAIKAEILERLGRIREACALYQKSAVLVDSLIATAPTPNVEAELLTQLSEVYSGDFGLLVRERKYAQAFEVVEKAHGRIVAQALEHHEVVAPHQPTAQEERISQLNLKLVDSDDPAVRVQIARALYEAELQLDDTSLAGRTATRPVPLKVLETDLHPTELVIEYVLAEPHSYALAITRDSVNVYRLPERHMIEQEASAYREILRDHQTDTTLAQKLFNELLAPIPEYGQKLSIILVPDGSLHLLPFSALVDKGSYTILSHTFSTEPSATVLHILRNRGKTKLSYPRTYLAVAASMPASTGNDSLLRAIEEPELSQLQPLPESRVEVEDIARLLPPPGTLLLGSKATETAFKHLPLNEYEVLHLALHGYANLEYPDRSALIFAPQDHSIDDGLLEIREIRRLHLRARLVTLSSCDAGVGPIEESGVADLVNAFLEAGAETVVSTLWEVDDNTTAHLMQRFYSSLAQHQNKSSALREAQLSVLRAGLPPYYWASFEIAGEPADSI